MYEYVLSTECSLVVLYKRDEKLIFASMYSQFYILRFNNKILKSLNSRV